jgi:transcriptional regulator with XRE-family HTH domain
MDKGNLIEKHVIDFVHKLRVDNNLKQSDIAKILKVGPSFIGNVENSNNPAKYNLKHIALLAAHFDLSPRLFLPEEQRTKRKHS